MANLKLEHIYKVYPNGTKAVNDFSLDIKNGEFIVFVGPSGCGKSTTLRMIAGLEDITAGELYIDSNIVNDMEPKDRDIAMVFQNYALYPHMTVYENMAFGLRIKHVPEDIIQEKVLWASEILGIKEYLDRKPRNMSGGQRQRVSLGRAILRDPKVMLLDEPLSNLDAKLRAQMRTEIARLHQRLKTTFIYVTHDQTEAMTLGDRVVVMKGGRIQQVDTPKNLYNYPENVFVAGFIGTPQMNFLDCTLLRKGEKVTLHLTENNQDIVLSYNYFIKALPQYLDGEHGLKLGVRCENITLVDEKTPGAIKVKISHFEELGSECLIYANLGDSDTSSEIIIKVRDIENLHVNDEIYVLFNPDKTYYFDKKTEDTITPRIPKYNSFSANIRSHKLSVLSSSIPLPLAINQGDIKDGELQVPVDAVTFNDHGIEAKVLTTEVISNSRLVHLETAGRVYFALTDKEFKDGDIVHVNFDFTRLTFVVDGKNIFEPIIKFDSVMAQFYNFETAMAEENRQEFVDYRDSKIKAARDFLSTEILLENNRYDKEVLDLKGKDLDALRNEAEASYSELVITNKKKMSELTHDFKEESKKVTDAFKNKKKEAIAENNKLFAEKKMKEETEYHEFLENNKDKITRKRRTDEYHIFKDNFQTDKDNTITRIINGMTQDYETEISKLRSEYRRNTDLLKKEIKNKKDELKKAQNPMKFIEKEHAAKLAELNKKLEEATKKAGFVFFFRFDQNYYSLLSDIISNKLIQGLGTRVFSRQFRVDIPHDAYTIREDNKGFKVVVESILNYGENYYMRCRYLTDNNAEQFVFVETKEPLSVGKELYLDIDLTRCQITETDMNIRLY